MTLCEQVPCIWHTTCKYEYAVIICLLLMALLWWGLQKCGDGFQPSNVSLYKQKLIPAPLCQLLSYRQSELSGIHNINEVEYSKTQTLCTTLDQARDLLTTLGKVLNVMTCKNQQFHTVTYNWPVITWHNNSALNTHINHADFKTIYYVHMHYILQLTLKFLLIVLYHFQKGYGQNGDKSKRRHQNSDRNGRVKTWQVKRWQTKTVTNTKITRNRARVSTR